ncbi:MAG: hypothetical protein P4N59_11090 [Negativicutes bacterium]|nr:hypothetical protein [Negativicutes bacterium]
MKIFIKRFWGFDPIYWPIVAFSLKGSLDRLLSLAEPGDLMAFVGTQGDQTKLEDRGRLLGFAEFGRNPFHSRQALPPQSFADAEKGSNGDIKWPHAVLITRAWKFTDVPPPVMTEVLGRQLPMAAMSNAILLSMDEQRRVLALPRNEVDVGITQAIRDERDRIAAAIGPGGGTMGPLPSSFSTTMVRDAFREACTYAYRFGNLNVWKVGWAHDPVERLKNLNNHVPYEVLHQKWEGGWTQKWASAEQAYAMEQRILQSFADSDRYGERVHCTEAQLEAAWRKAWRGN